MRIELFLGEEKNERSDHEDTLRHKGLRKNLIDIIREKGITDESVLRAMMEVPRHFFFDLEFENIAYEDRAFPIAANQTISQPYTVAFQTQLLKIKKYDKVLEVGTGSVYQATILAEIGATVFTIERQKELYTKAKNYVFKNKYKESRLKFFYGDGFEGLPKFAPFDKIIITCGAPFIPPKLIDQLKPGGIMVIPLAEDEHHKMYRITKNEDGSYVEEEFNNFSFVPMLPGTEPDKTAV
ncbi:MAG: protein-L-isoaspartate(D-aspartate) O-methyltransferase [Bacteroidota bacterium]